MGWVTGRLQSGADAQVLRLVTGARCSELQAGDVVERWNHSRWQRGRFEHSPLLGWLWTNGRIYYRLMGGDEMRLWDGRTWPSEAGKPEKQSG